MHKNLSLILEVSRDYDLVWFCLLFLVDTKGDGFKRVQLSMNHSNRLKLKPCIRVHPELEKLVLAIQIRVRVCIGLSSISLVKNLWTQRFSHGELDWSFRLPHELP